MLTISRTNHTHKKEKMKTKTSTPHTSFFSHLFTLAILIITLGVSDSVFAQTNGQKCYTGPNVGCQSCMVGYPDNSNLPRSAVVFSESDVLVASEPGPSTCGQAVTQIKLWYTDEHALTLGVRRVIVKNQGGVTTTTDYAVAPTPASPTCVSHPAVGTTVPSGDQSGNDVADGGGRPLRPALFITDLTTNGVNSRSGDWQQGGTAHDPSKVCGTWKAAVKTVDKTHNPELVTITPDGDPARNHTNLGGGDPYPAGLGEDGYTAEVVWDIADLGLLPGHTYRLQFMVHDGDQNKSGGDAGESCTTIVMPGGSGSPAPVIEATSNWTSDNVAHTVTIRTKINKEFCDNTYGANAIGWPSPGHTLSDLINGDKIHMELYDANGTKKMDFDQDYFSTSGSTPSGYKSSGVTGDGHLYSGSSGDILSMRTSMDSNFNDKGYVLTTNSPSTNSSYTPNATYPAWDYNVWYEIKVKQSAFGSAGFGYPEIPLVRCSPSKSGATDIVLTSTPCPTGTLTLGDQVFEDKNLNGHRDLGEPGVYGAAVHLYLDANNDNIPDGAAIATTITDSLGRYSFTGLSAGNYIVGVVLPYNTSLVPTNGGDPDNNINDDNNGVSVVNGEARSLAITLALGTEPTNDGDGSNGNLSLDFALVTNFGAIGDFVWNDLNQNGKQDLGEPGLANIIVKLYNCTTGALIATTVTDENGEYLFINVPATVAGTSYKVAFSNLPAGYTFTFKNKAGVATDVNSKVNQGTGTTDCFNLHAGEANNDIDAGAFNPGIVLAVTVSPLTGIFKEGVSILSWNTTLETNLHNFDIERSSNGVDFTTISSVRAFGNSSTYIHYGYNDKLPMAGTNFYRLRIIDANGSYKFSNIIVLNALVRGISITDVYPNPFMDKIQMHIVTENVQPIEVSIVDYVGRTLRVEHYTSQQGTNNITLGHLAGLQKGIYMVTIKAGSETKSSKLVKE